MRESSLVRELVDLFLNSAAQWPDRYSVTNQKQNQSNEIFTTIFGKHSFSIESVARASKRRRKGEGERISGGRQRQGWELLHA